MTQKPLLVALSLFGLAAGATGCFLGNSTVAECQKSCQHLYFDCAAGSPTETEAQCEAACGTSSSGVSCTNPQAFYNCVNAASCPTLQGLTGQSTMASCAGEGSCSFTTGTGTVIGGNGGSSSSGGSTFGGGSTSGGTTFGGGSTSGGTTFGGGSTSGGTTFGGGSTSSGGFTSGGSTSGGSTGGGMTAGSACTAPAAGQTDPCATAGLACMYTGGGTSGYQCELPTEFYPCLPAVGCAQGSPPLTCSAITLPTGSENLCVVDCAASTGCPTPSTTCQSVSGQSVCWYDLCGPGSSPDGGTANGTVYYAPCNAQGSGDGVCLPVTSGSGTVGICQQGGPLAAGATGCSPIRPAGGALATLCDGTSYCLTSFSGGTTSLCYPICGAQAPMAADGGPGCGTGTGCVGIGGDFGVCLESCTAGTTTCPSPTSCQNVGSSYCLP